MPQQFQKAPGPFHQYCQFQGQPQIINYYNMQQPVTNFAPHQAVYFNGTPSNHAQDYYNINFNEGAQFPQIPLQSMQFNQLTTYPGQSMPALDSSVQMSSGPNFSSFPQQRTGSLPKLTTNSKA